MPRIMLPLLLLLLPCLATASDEEENPLPPVMSYYQILPSLVANLASGGHYVRCDIQLMTEDQSLLEDFRLHDPAIRHILLMLLSEQDGDQIKSIEGKEALRKKAIEQIRALIKKETGKEGPQALFFTTFFVQ